jgi:hypothetical protein
MAIRMIFAHSCRPPPFTPIRISLTDLVVAIIEAQIERDTLEGHRGPVYQRLKKHMHDIHSDLGSETCRSFVKAHNGMQSFFDLWGHGEADIECNMLPDSTYLEETYPLYFDVQEFIEAGLAMETEAFSRQIQGKEIPEEENPSHTHFRFKVEELLAKDYVPYDWF